VIFISAFGPVCTEAMSAGVGFLNSNLAKRDCCQRSPLMSIFQSICQTYHCPSFNKGS